MLAARCIVAAGTGRGVFDGSVKVEQKAQKTDAGQLSRNLLLVPRATVNVKPNLQIVADDVKCTHGCAVSDLEEDQLFYFRQVTDSPSFPKCQENLVITGMSEHTEWKQEAPLPAFPTRDVCSPDLSAHFSLRTACGQLLQGDKACLTCDLRCTGLESSGIV